MTMAAAIEGRTADANAWSKASRIAERRYRARSRAPPRRSGAASKARRHSFTPYQRFDFLKPWQHQVGAREGLAPFIVIAFDANAGRCCCCRSRSGTPTARAAPASWAASMRPSTWRCGTTISPQARRRADLDGLISALSQRRRGRRAGAAPAAAALARPAESARAAAASALGQRLPAADDGARRRAHRAGQQLVPPPPQGQGAQAAVPARLSLSCRCNGGRHHAAARLVLPHQAAADGRTEAAQRVRRSRHRGFHPQRLPDAARRRQPRHRYPCAGMRRGSDRDLRRRRRRPSLLDDVQHLHDVGRIRNTAPA